MGSRSVRNKKHKIIQVLTGGKYWAVVILVILIFSAVYFSGANIWSGIKIFLIELFCVLFLYILVMRLKNRKNRVKEDTSQSEDERILFNEDLFVKKETSELRKLDASNFNWIIEKHDKNHTDEEGLKEILDKNADEEQNIADVGEDVRKQVADWSKTVDYSGSVFRRIIKRTYNSDAEEEDDAGNELVDNTHNEEHDDNKSVIIGINFGDLPESMEQDCDTDD